VDKISQAPMGAGRERTQNFNPRRTLLQIHLWILKFMLKTYSYDTCDIIATNDVSAVGLVEMN